MDRTRTDAADGKPKSKTRLKTELPRRNSGETETEVGTESAGSESPRVTGGMRGPVFWAEQISWEERCGETVRIAQALFDTSPDWIDYFREILGVDGAARQIFPRVDEFQRFTQTPEYARLQEMLHVLRRKRPGHDTEVEAMRVVTVRMPKCLHEALNEEARERKTSMNKLCITKLLQTLDD